MNKERLKQVIADLESPLPDHFEFDMKNWTMLTSCGTAGCAIGLHCLRHPDIPLRLDFGYPEFEDQDQWRAIETYFDLEGFEAIELFSTSFYWTNPKPQDIADRIKNFIKKKEEKTV